MTLLPTQRPALSQALYTVLPQFLPVNNLGDGEDDTALCSRSSMTPFWKGEATMNRSPENTKTAL